MNGVIDSSSRRRRRLSRFALGIAAAGLLAAPALAAESDLTLYADAIVIDGTGAPAHPHQDILVRGERIVSIAPHGTIAEGATARQVDLAGRYVIPGLIDSHVHLATPPNNVRAKALLRRNLFGGVTAVRDMADDLRPVGELSREALTGEIPAPDIYYAALMAGPPFFQDKRVLAVSVGARPGTAPWMQSIDDATDLPAAVTLARGTSATAIKIYADLPPRLVKAITAEAHRQNIRVWAHSAVFPTRPADVIAAGPDSVSHVCYLAYQAAPVMLAAYEDHTPVNEALLAKKGDDPVIAGLYREMLRRGTILDATGSLFVRPGKGHRCTGPATIRLTQQAWRAGVPISTGTDFSLGPDQQWPEVHEELLFLARDVGMPALQVIRSATLIGAEAAGQARDMGSIEPGKLANFVVLTRDPLADIANIRAIEMTVKRGRAYPRADYRPITKTELGDEDGD